MTHFAPRVVHFSFFKYIAYMYTIFIFEDFAHSERRPQNMYSQEEIATSNCMIKLATEISLFCITNVVT